MIWWFHCQLISNASISLPSWVLGNQTSWIFLLGNHFVQALDYSEEKKRGLEFVLAC